MRFYGREKELSELQTIREYSRTNSQFTMVTGRRRIGKTELILKSVKGSRFVYLFVSRVNQNILCRDMQEVLRTEGIDLAGEMTKVADILKAVMLFSRDENITLIMDEFQDLEKVDKAIFSEIQDVWDRYKDESRINLIVSGSVHTMMTRIFEDEKEPLFGRLTSKIVLKPLPIRVMEEVMRDHNPGYSAQDMLTFYMLTGGVPLYMKVLMDSGAYTSETMLSKVASIGSVFLVDGKDVLVSEFGKEYHTYFSILQMLSSGKEKRSEMEDVLGVELGVYLKRLEEEYGIIRHVSPVFSVPDGRNTRWVLKDMYLRFYFRFMLPGSSYIESGRYDLLRRSINRGLPEYEGRILEEFFRTRISEEDDYTEVGGYWNRKGDVEIDIVVVDDLEKRVRLIEVKRNPKKMNFAALKEKAESISHNLKDYDVSFESLSLDDVKR